MGVWKLIIAFVILEGSCVFSQCMQAPSCSIVQSCPIRPVGSFVIPAIIKPILQPEPIAVAAPPPVVPNFPDIPFCGGYPTPFPGAFPAPCGLPPIILDSDNDRTPNLLYLLLLALTKRNRFGSLGLGSCGGYGNGCSCCGCNNGCNSGCNCGCNCGCCNCCNGGCKCCCCNNTCCCGRYGHNNGCCTNCGSCCCGGCCNYIPYPIPVPCCPCDCKYPNSDNPGVVQGNPTPEIKVIIRTSDDDSTPSPSPSSAAAAAAAAAAAGAGS